MIIAGSNRHKDCLQFFSLTKHQLIQSIDWELTSKKDIEAGFVFGTRFSKPKADLIFAGGAGKNEVKVFENNCDGSATMRILATINEFDSPILSMDTAKNGDVAVGLQDGRIVIINSKLEEPYGDFEGYQGGFSIDKVNETLLAKEVAHNMHIHTHGHGVARNMHGFTSGGASPTKA